MIEPEHQNPTKKAAKIASADNARFRDDIERLMTALFCPTDYVNVAVMSEFDYWRDTMIVTDVSLFALDHYGTSPGDGGAVAISECTRRYNEAGETHEQDPHLISIPMPFVANYEHLIRESGLPDPTVILRDDWHVAVWRLCHTVTIEQYDELRRWMSYKLGVPELERFDNCDNDLILPGPMPSAWSCNSIVRLTQENVYTFKELDRCYSSKASPAAARNAFYHRRR